MIYNEGTTTPPIIHLQFNYYMLLLVITFNILSCFAEQSIVITFRYILHCPLFNQEGSGLTDVPIQASLATLYNSYNTGLGLNIKVLSVFHYFQR